MTNATNNKVVDELKVDKLTARIWVTKHDSVKGFGFFVPTIDPRGEAVTNLTLAECEVDCFVQMVQVHSIARREKNLFIGSARKSITGDQPDPASYKTDIYKYVRPV